MSRKADDQLDIPNLVRTAQRAVRAITITLPAGVAVAVMATLNPSWLFNVPGWLDPWIYTSLSRTWSNPDAWDWYYKTSRLGWVLPAWLAHPITASYWGHLLFAAALVALTGAAIGLAVGRLLGRTPGALAGLLCAGWGALQLSGGADYHNQIAGLWLGLGLLALTWLSAKGQPRVQFTASVFGGIFFGLAVHSTPIMANLVPFVAVFALAVMLKGMPSLQRGALLAAGWVGGAIATTFLLALASLTAGREFLFFLKGADLASGLLTNPSGQSTWWMQISWRWPVTSENMVGYAWHLVIVVVGLIAAALVLIRWRLRNPRRANASVVLAGGVLLTGLIFTVWQVVGQTSLQPEYFTYPLGLCAAIGIALVPADSAGTSPSWAESHGRSLAVAAALGLAFAVPLAFFAALPGWLGSPPSYANWIAAVALGLAAVAFLARSPRTWALLVAVLLLGSSNLVALARVGQRNYSWSPTECRGENGHIYASMVSAGRWIEDVTGSPLGTSSPGPVLWWAEQAENAGISPCGRSLADMGASMIQLGFKPFPGLNSGDPAGFADVPRETLSFLAADQIPVVLLTPGRTQPSPLPPSSGFRSECRAQRYWPIERGAGFSTCISYVSPAATGASRKQGMTP